MAGSGVAAQYLHVATRAQPVAWQGASGLRSIRHGIPSVPQQRPTTSRISRDAGAKAAALRPVAAGGGFGQKASGKTKSKPEGIDFRRVASVDTYKLFVRRLGESWGPLGEVLVEEGTDVGQALRERKKALLTAVHHQYPLFLRPTIEELEFGIYKDKDAPKTGQLAPNATNSVERMDVPEAEIAAVSLGGRADEVATPATLRVEDGVSRAPKYKR